MKRIGYLFEKIISIENLELADANARKGKKRKRAIAKHDEKRRANIERLHQQLKDKTFKTSPYKKRDIQEKKTRTIYSLPYYPDRIVHHAIIQVLKPIWLKTLTYNTYSCVEGRGIEACRKQVRKIIDRYRDSDTLYCLQIDIRKFYPSIDHDVMKMIVRKKIKDPDVLWLLDDIINSTEGMPIGNYSSQWLANLMLSYIMHYVNEILRIHAVEFADDIPFMSTSKERLHEALNVVRTKLKEEFHLDVKSNWQIFPIAKNKYDRHGRALDFIGYKFYREQTLVRKCIKYNLCKKAAKLNKRKHITAKEYRMAISPWLGWCKSCNGIHLLETIIKHKDYENIVFKKTKRTA